MSERNDYSINEKIRFLPLQLIDIPALVGENQQKWRNYSLSKVNDCVVRLGIIEGEFHWHQHDQEDEFFYVIDGRLIIDLEGRAVELTPQQAFLVPRGVRHRTRAPEHTTILMIEGGTVTPTGD